MITFKQIELTDKEDIDDCLAQNTYRGCDFSFTNLYAWKAQYKAVYAIIGNTIFFRLTDSQGCPCYLMPIGDMPLLEAIDKIKRDAKALGVPFQMKKVSPEMKEEIEKVYPNQFEYIPDAKNNEYIYLSEKLIKLSGKKLQSKRNHVNRFKREYPNWEYFSITTDAHIAQCKAMHNEWNEKYADLSGEGIEYDYIATQIMLDNYHQLGLKGGAITVDGRIVAFSIGSVLTNDTFGVHVEKAFSDVEGAYTMINQQFVEHEAADYTYINREEDMGLENLRKAKMSYYPDILLGEGVLIAKNDTISKQRNNAPCIPNVESMFW